MLVSEVGCIRTLPQVYDENECPYWGRNPIQKDARTDCTCEPPELGMTIQIRIWWHAPGVEQQEDEGRCGPDLNGSSKCVICGALT